MFLFHPKRFQTVIFKWIMIQVNSARVEDKQSQQSNLLKALRVKIIFFFFADLFQTVDNILSKIAICHAHK